MTWVAVAAGGALGTLARHVVNVIFARLLERPMPYATAAVNISGSAIIGILAGLLASGRLHMSNNTRTFVFVGILGGFTTFSSYMLDTLTLTHGGERVLALSNIAVQTALGLTTIWVGYRLAVLGG
jgi:fluoride exporter